MGSHKLSATAIKSPKSGHMLIHKQIRKCSGFPISIDQCRIDKCKGNTKFLSQLVTTENHMPNHCFFNIDCFLQYQFLWKPYNISQEQPSLATMFLWFGNIEWNDFCCKECSRTQTKIYPNHNKHGKLLLHLANYPQLLLNRADNCWISQTVRNCC